jgi:methyl-accepting chemotaxis protein
MVIGLIAAIIIGAGFALVITRSIVGPMLQGVAFARAVAQGDLSQTIAIRQKDEIGLLADALRNMQATIQNVLDEIQRLILAVQQGRLDMRGDARAFEGSWGELVTGLNNVVDALMAPFNVAAEYIDRIAKGDIPAKITDEYQGDFNEIKNNLNGLVENLETLTDAANAIAAGDTSVTVEKRSAQDRLVMAFQHMIATVTSLIQEMNALAEAAQAGRLDTRGDAASFQGDFARIVHGVNATLDAVIGPLNVAAEYVDRIAHGDIPEPITEEYQGDFNEIKNNLNQCIAAINGLAAEAGRLTDAAVAGQLSVRGETAKFQGRFARIVQGVNDTLDAVIGPLNVAAEYVDRIAKGDVPDNITAEYRGDFNAIKQNLNILIGAMHTITGLAEEMATGNLDVEVIARSGQDRLMQALSDMVVRLNGVLSDVKTASGNVAVGSQAMSSGAQQMSQGATEQAAAAEEASSSMEEMAANIRQNSDNAMQTEKIAIKAAEDARESGVAVAEAVSAMQEIVKRVLIIEDITRQTRMLSLNATIEAARAQEHGRGFSVVASEVRSLAERSQSAANEINGLATSSLKVAERAGDMLKRLVPDIQKTAELVQEITAASREQTTGTGQINKAIQQLDTVTQQNSATSEEIAATAEELAAQADMLRQTIAFFRVKGGDESTDARLDQRDFRAQAVKASRLTSGPKAARARKDEEHAEQARVELAESPGPADPHDDEFERF